MNERGDPGELVTAAEAARALSIQAQTVRRWVRAGRLEPVDHRELGRGFGEPALYRLEEVRAVAESMAQRPGTILANRRWRPTPD